MLGKVQETTRIPLWLKQSEEGETGREKKDQTLTSTLHETGFPGDSDNKESACNAGDLGFIPGSGRAPGKGTGYLLQYSCLENSMDRGAW